MKKVLAILMTLVLCLSCVGVMAEEADTYGITPPLTRGKGYSINVEVVMNLAKAAGMTEKDQTALSALLAVMSSASTKTVDAENGSQGELFLKGATIADYVMAEEGDKIVLSTSLLPHYTLTLSEETIVSFFENVLEEALKDLDSFQDVIEKAAKAFEGVNFDALDKNYAVYSQEAVAEFLSSVALSDVEAAEYTFEDKDVAFNAKQTFEVDIQQAVNAAGNLMNKKLKDENVPALVAAFNSLGVKIDLPTEVSAETLKVENGATVQGTVYSIVNENGEPADAPLLVEVKAYQDGTAEVDMDRITIFVSDADCFVSLVMPNDQTFISFTADAVDENAADFKYTLTDNSGYYAVDGNISLLEDSTVFVNNALYYMDPDTPIMIAFDSVAPGGELTLPLYSDEKTVLSVEELMQDAEGKAGAFLMIDLLNNGLSGLITNIVTAIPNEIANLLSLAVPQQ